MMPTIKYCAGYGAQKARIAATPFGTALKAQHLREAHSLRGVARAMGLRVSMRQVARGKPEHTVTILGKGGVK